ncbi:unnamed protein product [Ectocarpus sp. 8 AP-2014]
MLSRLECLPTTQQILAVILVFRQVPPPRSSPSSSRLPCLSPFALSFTQFQLPPTTLGGGVCPLSLPGREESVHFFPTRRAPVNVPEVAPLWHPSRRVSPEPCLTFSATKMAQQQQNIASTSL